MERATDAEMYGCGSHQTTDITLNIQTTTGGNFSISVNGKHTVDHLKKLVSKKLRVPKDRMCLLHRERQLRDGTLEENGLMDGSKIILLPSVETGLLSQRPENSVMQALESLNDNQVNDFLSGKSPLNLTMRLGDHMMLIQLQLSTLNSSRSGTRSLRTSTPTKLSSSSSTKTTIKNDVQENEVQTNSYTSIQISNEPNSSIKTDSNADDIEKISLKKEDLEVLCNNIYSPLAEHKDDDKSDQEMKDAIDLNDTIDTVSNTSSIVDIENSSPIKSLSNLVSSPLNASDTSDTIQKATLEAVKSSLVKMLTNRCSENATVSNQQPLPKKPIEVKPLIIHAGSSSDDSDTFTDQSSFLTESTIDEYPMENLFNSAVDKGLFENQDESMMDREISNLAMTTHSNDETPRSGSIPSFHSISEPLKNKRFQYLLHKTSKFKHTLGQNKQKVFMQSVVNKHKKRMQSRQDNEESQPSTSRAEPYSPRKLMLQNNSINDPQPSTSRQEFQVLTPESPQSLPDTPTPPLVPDTSALLEASKNLTQTLKKLSKEVLTNKKIDVKSAKEIMRTKVGSGAVIESMKHHGKGIYSGTFSGTLNPALQDRYGRPKRDISTIIHILNDLLCAAPPITIAQKETKPESSTEATKTCLGCSKPFYPRGKCDGHLASTSASEAAACCLNHSCNCKSRLKSALQSCSHCSLKPYSNRPCKSCDTAKTFELENSKTKCKLEHLRLVMQQKKERREARKLKTMPYNPPKSLGSPEQNSAIPEEIETLA